MVINELLEKHHENYRQKYGRSPLVIRLIPGLFAQFLIEFQVAPENTESCFWNFIPVVRDSTLANSIEMEPVKPDFSVPESYKPQKEYASWMYGLHLNEAGNVVADVLAPSRTTQIEITEKDLRRMLHLFEIQ